LRRDAAVGRRETQRVDVAILGKNVPKEEKNEENWTPAELSHFITYRRDEGNREKGGRQKKERAQKILKKGVLKKKRQE